MRERKIGQNVDSVWSRDASTSRSLSNSTSMSMSSRRLV